MVVRAVQASTRHGSQSGGGGGSSGGRGSSGGSSLGADGDLGACLFALSEYGSGVFGMAAVQELSRHRVRSVAKLVRADTEVITRACLCLK